MKMRLIVGLTCALLATSAFGHSEMTVTCGDTVLQFGDDGHPNLTVPKKQNLSVKSKKPTIVTNRLGTTEELSYFVDNGTSETLEYLFIGVAKCVEDQKAKLRIYGKTPGARQKTFIRQVTCECGEA